MLTVSLFCFWVKDETMHSGADVEAFQAALNRDIEGDVSASQQPSDSDSGILLKLSVIGFSVINFGVWLNIREHDWFEWKFFCFFFVF